ncbi:MAG: helix-hairpin-helix domain-containing protein [Candidatus Omnitrophica bacterium]|nr:helix-hairpin-helix domain-containing protein [Candidatus Omnitrophota bacterium]
MLNFTPEERKVFLFVLGLAFFGLILNYLVKVNGHIEKMINPQIELARINLNKVSLEELIESRCISAKLAERIMEYRSLHKEFSNLEELKEVKGIGNQRYEKLNKIFFIE